MALSYRPHLLRNTSVYSPAKKTASQPIDAFGFHCTTLGGIHCGNGTQQLRPSKIPGLPSIFIF